VGSGWYRERCILPGASSGGAEPGFARREPAAQGR
jgi:hypothetical protein